MEKAVAQPQAVPEILLLTHGYLGAEMLKSAEMIIGRVEHVHTIPLTPQVSVEDYRLQVKQAIQAMPEGSIVLADLFGGTVHLVAGVNLTALIDSIQLREECQGRELCEQVAQGAREGVRMICL